MPHFGFEPSDQLGGKINKWAGMVWRCVSQGDRERFGPECVEGVTAPDLDANNDHEHQRQQRHTAGG